MESRASDEETSSVSTPDFEDPEIGADIVGRIDARLRVAMAHAVIQDNFVAQALLVKMQDFLTRQRVRLSTTLDIIHPEERFASLSRLACQDYIAPYHARATRTYFSVAKAALGTEGSRFNQEGLLHALMGASLTGHFMAAHVLIAHLTDDYRLFIEARQTSLRSFLDVEVPAPSRSSTPVFEALLGGISDGDEPSTDTEESKSAHSGQGVR